MSGPDWLAKMSSHAETAREERKEENEKARLGLAFREAAPEEINIDRRFGEWFIEWNYRGELRGGWPTDDDAMPGVLVDQWSDPTLQGISFSPDAMLFLYRGRFVIAEFAGATDFMVKASDLLDPTSALLQREPGFQEPANEDELDALLASLPGSSAKAEAEERRALLRYQNAREELSSQWDFTGVITNVITVPDGTVGFIHDPLEDYWTAQLGQIDGGEPLEEPLSAGTFKPDILTWKLLNSRVKAVSMGNIAGLLDQHLFLHRGHWAIVVCEALDVPQHLSVELSAMSSEHMDEQIMFSSCLQQEVAPAVAEALGSEPEVVGPEIDALFAVLPDDPETRTDVEAEAGPPPGARRRQGVPEAVRHEVWRRDQGQCVRCGSQERLEFDHIIPWSRGGSDTARNLQLLCEACNRSKSARI